MTREEQFIAALKENVRSDKEQGTPTLVQGIVQTVSDTTCTVKLLTSDLEITGVRYRATDEATKGWALLPKKGTNCLVGFIGDTIDQPYLVAMDEVKQVKLILDNIELVIDKNGSVFNEGQLGGLVISEKVSNEIAEIKQDLNALKNIFKTWLVSAGDGGAKLKGASTSWALQNLTVRQKSFYENEKLKH